MNMLQGGSIRNTLSGEAWNHRTQKYWGWTHTAIDMIFGAGHCQRAAETETKYGSIWASWWNDIKPG